MNQLGIRVSHLVLIIYWICLFLATHTNVPVDHVGPDLPNFDKVVHAAAFALLGFLMAWSCRTVRCFDARWMTGFTIIAVYAILDEWTQNFVEQRFADFWDGLADVVGAAIGMTSFCLLQRLVRKN